MEYRLMNDKDESQIKALWSYCFEPEDHPFFKWYFSDYYDQKNVLAGFQADSLLCAVHLNPYQLRLRGHDFATSYIVGVATFPEGRSQRLVGGLLKAAFVEMHQRHEAVTILMPFQGKFYYPYDFEFCYHHIKYTLPLVDLKFTAQGAGKFVVLEKQHISCLQQVYKAFTADKHGYVLRHDENWRMLLAEHKSDQGYAYMLVEEEQPVGYILYTMRNDVLLVKELAYVNFAAEQQLLHFCYNHHSQVSMLEWNAPLDDGLLFSLPDPKRGVALYPFMTGRIVDVSEALMSAFYPAGSQAEVIFAVTDRLAPWNEGIFQLTVVEGKGTVRVVPQSTMNCDKLCILSVGALSQLFFGRLSASQLKKLGRLTAPSSVIGVLNKLFPMCTNYINEYF
ncbi:putative acetyltransferase [Sporomusaceae bacterium BoRhaA]|uniref:GNAT family N-acetyltransferase n=1 Tax=Pelorhabdus rhamnosifermentans TaxID=2772457 RepID=UPI001C061619|nr:GNAT family N-acetyltransferase [Pelorhabdus rhamnosifermentans]MBU2700714.1 putative acetyltransferase [Pelorhabdus rhamnosifermentans]